MTDPILAIPVQGKGRMYQRPGSDELYPSVTNVIGVLDKPALMPWAAREVAGAAWDQRHALVNVEDRDIAVDMLKNAYRRRRDRAANVGTVVHAVAEALSRDESLPVFTDEEAPYLDAFMDFITEFEPTFRAVEVTVLSDKHRYAGTADGLALIGDALVLFDHKTGSGVYRETCLQLAALRNAELMWDRETGDLTPLPVVDACIAVHLRPGKFTVYPLEAGRETFEAFLGLRQAWDWTTGGGGVGPSQNRARLGSWIDLHRSAELRLV